MDYGRRPPSEDFARGVITLAAEGGQEVVIEATSSWAFVGAGLRIQLMAKDLAHPRIVYPLPNGDILVVEGNGPGTQPYRPKDYISGKIKARAGAGAHGGNRITLLRDADGDGVAEVKTVFLEGLNSPFGMALIFSQPDW